MALCSAETLDDGVWEVMADTVGHAGQGIS
jgi:hypothetical protein